VYKIYSLQCVIAFTGQNKPPASQLGSYRNVSHNSSVGTAYQGGNTSNNATRRMLSAGRLKINELRNKVTELTVHLANVQSENKQLMRQQRQQVIDVFISAVHII